MRLRHDVAVRAVRFAATTPPARRPGLDALETADASSIAPSNPIVSIGPIRALPGVDELLAGRRDHVVAVSPIVGGAALKGPADRMLAELGHEPTVVGVARLYAPIAATLVIDPADAALAATVEAAGMRALVVPSVMTTPRPRPRSTATSSRRHPRLARRTTPDAQRSLGARIAARPSSSGGPGRPAEVDPGPDRRDREAGQLVDRRRTYTGGGPAAASSAHRSRTDVCTPVPMLTTRPLPRRPDRTRASTTSSTNTKSRVWRPSPAMRGASPPRGGRDRRGDHATVGPLARAVHQATARAVNSMPERSR